LRRLLETAILCGTLVSDGQVVEEVAADRSVCGCLIEHPPGLVGAGNRRTDRAITVDERYSRPLRCPTGSATPPGGWRCRAHHPSVPEISGVASAADAVVGMTMTSSRFIDR
jgi:hypothetical protein